MPRTNLGKTTRKQPLSPQEQFNRLIRMGMARNGIISQAELAGVLGMERSSVRRRMAGETNWTWTELCRLFRVLEFTPEEAAQAMCVRPV